MKPSIVYVFACLFISLTHLKVSAQDVKLVFNPQVIDDDVNIGYGVAIGDVDGDGKKDILLADKKQFVWYRNGDWKRFVLAENLTEHDNVCIAARDINGDGKVEVAVGAQWNPGETSDTAQSGSVHYLASPSDPTKPWKAIALHHEPTVHRMRWVQTKKNSYGLLVLPLHGRGNKDGEGAGSKAILYKMPEDPTEKWATEVIYDKMHLTHNFDYLEKDNETEIMIGGKEGLALVTLPPKKVEDQWNNISSGIGEVRTGNMKGGERFIATIEPMHGNQLVVYPLNGNRTVLDSTLNQGHALACEDLLGVGYDQIVVGWRNPDSEGKVGIKLFTPEKGNVNNWQMHLIDDDNMACEDLMVEDLDGDGKPEIIASGRATNNLIIYWNKN